MIPDTSSKITIGDFSIQAGVATSLVRYYEYLGLIQSQRTAGGQRRYDQESLLAMRRVRFARSAGFTLREILDLLGPAGPQPTIFAEWEGSVRNKIGQLDQMIEDANEMKRVLGNILERRCSNAADCNLLQG